MPALLTSTSGSPSVFATSSAAASIERRSVMSQSMRRSLSPAPLATAANAADAAVPGKSNAATRAPASSNASTQIGPSFPQAPVTTATSSSRRNPLTLRPCSGDPELAEGSRTCELDVPAENLESEKVVLVQWLQRRVPEDLVELIR